MRLKITKTAIGRMTAAPKPYDIYDTELSGLVFRIEPTGRRSWYFVYRAAGVRRRFRIGTYPGVSVEGARREAKKLAGRVAAGLDPQATLERQRVDAARDRVSTLRTFLIHRYEPWAQAHLRTGGEQVKRINADFKNWMDHPLASLSLLLVENWRREQLKGGKKPVTVNRDLQRLRALLSKALEWRVIDVHPFAAVRPLRTDRRGRVRYLSAEEEARLREALTVRENNLRGARDRFNAWRTERGFKPLPRRDGAFVDHVKPMVLVALNTGLRRGELLALRWDDVDMSAKHITVRGENAKSGQTRSIPLNPEALRTLEAWWGTRGARTECNRVFVRSNGESLARIDTAWDTVTDLAKLSNFRFHDCRHHFASKLVMAGVPLNTVRELLGHSSLEMTMRYAHLAPENLVAAVQKLGQAGAS